MSPHRRGGMVGAPLFDVLHTDGQAFGSLRNFARSQRVRLGQALSLAASFAAVAVDCCGLPAAGDRAGRGTADRQSRTPLALFSPYR